MALSEDRIRYLEMIQSSIGRISDRSSLLKNWAVTITVGLVAYSRETSDPVVVLLALLPVLVFWSLDVTYQRQQKAFRDLFDSVRQNQSGDPDYTLDVRQGLARIGFGQFALKSSLLRVYGVLTIFVVLFVLTCQACS